MQTIDRQIVGAIVLVLLINVGFILKGFFGGERPWSPPPLAEQKPGYKTIELKGPARAQGVYFVPPDTTLSGFLDLLVIKGKTDFSKKELSRVLASGDVVEIPETANSRTILARGGLQNSKRHVLDMPMNINTATADDLMLVPGIGEKTADAIIQTRKDLGGFKQIDDLLEVRGIGQKKLEVFRKYFCIGTQCAS
jgi:competence protein ComEA